MIIAFPGLQRPFGLNEFIYSQTHTYTQSFYVFWESYFGQVENASLIRAPVICNCFMVKNASMRLLLAAAASCFFPSLSHLISLRLVNIWPCFVLFKLFLFVQLASGVPADWPFGSVGLLGSLKCSVGLRVSVSALHCSRVVVVVVVLVLGFFLLFWRFLLRSVCLFYCFSAYSC